MHEGLEDFFPHKVDTIKLLRMALTQYVRTCKHTLVHRHTYEETFTRIHEYTHTHTHTYIYIYTSYTNVCMYTS